MEGYDERIINGYRVELRYDRAMHWPVVRTGQAMTAVQEGVSITVTRPEPEYWSQTGDEPHYRRLYGPPYGREGDGYEGQFPWPGRHAWRDDVRNTLGQNGAYVFEPASEEEVEAFLAPRIRRAIEKARKRDRPTIVALQPIKPYEGPQWLVEPLSPAFTVGGEEWGDLGEWRRWEEATERIIDTTIAGWGDHNAIARYEGQFGHRRDYLATILYLTPAYVADDAREEVTAP